MNMVKVRVMLIVMGAEKGSIKVKHMWVALT